MEGHRRTGSGWLVKKLRTQFIAGLLITLPLGATVLILIWIFNTIDDILQPSIQYLSGRNIPGVGLVLTIVLIYLAGVIASNFIGRRLIRYGESLLAMVPLVRPLYAGIKQILVSLSSPDKSVFMQVVLVEFPIKGMQSIGFITNEISSPSGKKLLNVFIPQSPIPTSGFLEIMSEEQVTRTNIPVDDALKMVVSAGRLAPDGFINGLPPIF
ncbi:MAG: transporter [Dehalococcoidales bacterium]|nr:transporter [Dehalococcoidales bacterium]